MPDAAVRDLRMRDQVLGRSHDRRDAGLVVRAEQRRARRRDDVVPDLRGEFGPIRRAQHRRRIVGQHDVVAVPVPVHDRHDAGAAHLGRRVDVREKPDGWSGDAGVAGMVAKR